MGKAILRTTRRRGARRAFLYSIKWFLVVFFSTRLRPINLKIP
jgi:hypothetical protein